MKKFYFLLILIFLFCSSLASFSKTNEFDSQNCLMPVTIYKENGMYGMKSNNGIDILEPKYLNIKCSKPLIITEDENQKYSFLLYFLQDNSFEHISPNEKFEYYNFGYKYERYGANIYLILRKNGVYGVYEIRKAPKGMYYKDVVNTVPFIYDDIQVFLGYNCKYYAYAQKGNKWGIINIANGMPVTEFKYKSKRSLKSKMMKISKEPTKIHWMLERAASFILGILFD